MTKFTELAEEENASTNDLLCITHDPSTTAVSKKITVGNLTKLMTIMWCEKNGKMDAATGSGLQFSWGNGGFGNYGPRQYRDGSVIAMSIETETDDNTAGTGRVELAKNGVSMGSDYRVVNQGSNHSGQYLEFSTPLNFVAGDRITAKTTQTPSGGTTTHNVVIAFWILYNYET